MNLFRKIKISNQKANREIINAINKFAKVDKCILCKKKMTSACNSHVVPQFILKQISENGKISYGNSMQTLTLEGLEKTTGINNAYTFRLICNQCDKVSFKEYENPNNLLVFDTLNDKLKEKMLMEMAIKTRLSHISLKYKNAITKDIITNGEFSRLEKLGAFVPGERIEMNSHFEAIDRMRYKYNNNKRLFKVLLNKELDYQTKIATQTIISFNYDLYGKQIYDYNYISYDNQCSYFYLMILPYNGKTRIIFYIEEEYYIKVKNLINQFQQMDLLEQIHFLFIALILHDEQFYLTPSLAEYIKKRDKKIMRLYSKTEINLKFTRKIRDYKKYNNYLSKEYSNYGNE